MTDRVDLLERLLDDERLGDITLDQLRAVVSHIDWLGSQPVSTLAFEEDEEAIRPSDLYERHHAIQMLRSALKFVQKAGEAEADPRYVEQWPTVVQRALALTDRFDGREDQEEFDDAPSSSPTPTQPGLPDLSGPFRRR